MTRREQIVAVLNGEIPDTVPLLGECPMDVTVFRDLLPTPSGDQLRDDIAFAEFFDNCGVGVGLGPRQETLSRDEHHHCYRYETGAVWLEKYTPTFCREATAFPINAPEEALAFTMPDANAPDRFNDEEVRATVRAFHDAGYFVEGGAMGAWAGIYYYLTSFDNILTWMACETEAAHALFEMTTRFSLDSAKRLLACGVDDIFVASDLGSGNGLLFSRAMFLEYVFPWMKSLAELCHNAGAYLHLHSHGHIEGLMDDIVAAGVDLINPIGPSDRNDLGMFKRRWGDRITLHGGISTTINTMTADEILAHVAEVMAVGRPGARFIPRTESGIPPMPLERVQVYLAALKQERARGYR